MVAARPGGCRRGRGADVKDRILSTRRALLLLTSVPVLVLLVALAAAALPGYRPRRRRPVRLPHHRVTAAVRRSCGSPFASTLVAPREDSGIHDATGVRMRLVDGRQYDYPGAQASWGMDNLNSYLVTSDTFYLDRAVLQAQRLIDTSTHVGDAWFFPSLYKRDRHSYRNDPMTVPWYSCLGQGAGLALFCRLYEVTGDPKWAEASAGSLLGVPRQGTAQGRLGHRRRPRLPLVRGVAQAGPRPHHQRVRVRYVRGYEYWRVFGDDRAGQLFAERPRRYCTRSPSSASRGG